MWRDWLDSFNHFSLLSPAMTSFHYPSQCLSRPFVMFWPQRLLLLLNFLKVFQKLQYYKALHSLTHDRFHCMFISSSSCRTLLSFTMDFTSPLVTSLGSDYPLLCFNGKKSRFHLWPLGSVDSDSKYQLNPQISLLLFNISGFLRPRCNKTQAKASTLGKLVQRLITRRGIKKWLSLFLA